MAAIDDAHAKLGELTGLVQQMSDEQAVQAAQAAADASDNSVPAVKRQMRAEYPPFILAGMALVGIITLVLTHHAVPEVMNTIALSATVGGAAIATPTIVNKLGGGE